MPATRMNSISLSVSSQCPQFTQPASPLAGRSGWLSSDFQVRCLSLVFARLRIKNFPEGKKVMSDLDRCQDNGRSLIFEKLTPDERRAVDVAIIERIPPTFSALWM